MKRSRSYEAKVALLEREKAYPVHEAIELLKKTSTAKFPETAEAAIVLGINPSQHQVRGTCALPHGTGKAVRVLVFARGEKVREAEAAGADYAGGEELAEKIQKEGWLEFERVVATPDMMSIVGKLGKILGPRGLMPSPKTNTVTMDVAAAVRELKAGMIEFRADRAGIVHSIFGKTDFTAEALQENLVALIRAVLERKPEGVRGRYIQRVFISATMGPGIRVDEADLLAAAQRKG
ncbi:MAG: 50S ribosomal protein L1 [Candidatus Bipolaricaulis sp.]|jgi:large subunit ribosomal protein L1